MTNLMYMWSQISSPQNPKQLQREKVKSKVQKLDRHTWAVVGQVTYFLQWPTENSWPRCSGHWTEPGWETFYRKKGLGTFTPGLERETPRECSRGEVMKQMWQLSAVCVPDLDPRSGTRGDAVEAAGESIWQQCPHCFLLLRTEWGWCGRASPI